MRSCEDDRAEGEVMKVTSRLAKIRERLQGVTIENMDYKDFVHKYSNQESFTFLDPPYPSAKMNWKWCPTQEEFESFSKTVPGKWMITYEVCDGWKESEYYRKILSQYNLAAPSSGHMTRKSELVVTNYPMEQNTSYLSASCLDFEETEEALNFMNSIDVSIVESKDDLQSILEKVLKLYAAKRRGEEIKQSFEELKKSFRETMVKLINSGVTNFAPEKLQKFARELFDKYTEYKYLVAQPDGNIQAFDSLEALKNSGIDYRGYKLQITMKEAEKNIGNFSYYKQWWKSKHLEGQGIENFVISTDLDIDIYLDNDLLNDELKENIFYIKPSRYNTYKITESVTFITPNTEFNTTSMPSWVKELDRGKISILESSELEKVIEISGSKLKGTYIAKRSTDTSDFWSLNKKT